MMYICPNGKIRVVIYGVHSADWMSALDPSAGVWRNISGVEEVLSLPHNEFKELRLTKDRSVKTVLIPLMESHVLSCPSGYFTLMPSAENVHRFGLKNKFAEYMQEIGRAHLCPTHFKTFDSVHYPCVVKRVNLCAGIGVALVQSNEELRVLARQQLWHKQPVIVQEALLDGDEFVTHLVVKNGRILWHATFAYKLIENEYIRTPSNVINAYRTVAEPHVLQALESCLMPSNYSGPCNIDYKVSDKGVLKILEINPRLGGSLMRPDAVDLLTEALACIIHNAQLSS